MCLLGRTKWFRYLFANEKLKYVAQEQKCYPERSFATSAHDLTWITFNSFWCPYSLLFDDCFFLCIQTSFLLFCLVNHDLEQNYCWSSCHCELASDPSQGVKITPEIIKISLKIIELRNKNVKNSRVEGGSPHIWGDFAVAWIVT